MPGKIIKKYNKIFVEFEYNGKRTSQIVPSISVGHQVLKQLSLELQESTPEIYFETFTEKYLKSIKTTCKPSTYTDYKSIITNHIEPEFYGTQIDLIKKTHIREFLQSKLETNSVSTVKHIKAVLAGIFWIAVEDNIIKTNPALSIRNIFPKKSTSSKRFLTKKQVELILETAKNHKKKYYPFILLLARTGMRLGEARALKWKDLDFENRSIYVNRSIVRGIIGTPKNHEIRTVDMSHQLCETLKNVDRKSEWIFPGRDNKKPFDGDAFRLRVFKPIIKKANLQESTRIHDLRHAYASTMIQNGVNIKYVSDQLGHHSISITADIYGHLEPNSNKPAVDNLDSKLILQ